METTSEVSVVRKMYTSSAVTLMPALIVGAMFLLAAAASSRTSGLVPPVWQVAESSGAEAGLLSAAVGTLRIHRGLESTVCDVFLTESATNVLSKAQNALEKPELLTGTDRVTLEIPLHDLQLDRPELRDTGRQLAQILSRRMEALELRATLRVLRAEDILQALALAEAMLAEAALSADQIGIGIDARMKADVVAIELVRSIRPVRMQEPAP